MLSMFFFLAEKLLSRNNEKIKNNDLSNRGSYIIKALCKTRLVVSVSHGTLRKPKLPLLQIHGAEGTTVAKPLHENQKTTSLGIRLTFLSHMYPCSNVKSRFEDILVSIGPLQKSNYNKNIPPTFPVVVNMRRYPLKNFAKSFAHVKN